MNISSIPYDVTQLNCGHCKKLCEKPTMTRCQHLFCKACIERSKPTVCPTCQAPFKAKHLVSSIVHQELIDKVKQSQQEALPIEPSEPHDARASLFQKLKFPREREEIGILKKVLHSKAVEKESEEQIVIRFANFVKNLPDRGFLDNDENEILDLMLFNMVEVQGMTDPETLRKILISCLSQQHLSLKLRMQGFAAFRNALESIPTPKDNICILETLRKLANHVKFPENHIKSLICLIKTHAQGPARHELLFDLSSDCSIREFCRREVLPLITDALLSDLINESMSIPETRRQIINLGWLLNKECLTEANIHTFTTFLFDCISRPELSTLHSLSISTLIGWICQTHSQHRFTLTAERKKGLDALILFFKTCSNEKTQMVIITELFSKGFDFSQRSPHTLYFFNAHLSLLQETDLPPLILEALAKRMILNLKYCKDHMRLTVMYLMLERIYNPSTTRPVVKMYVAVLAENLTHLVYSQILRNNQFTLTRFEELLYLDLIKNDPELLQIAKNIRKPA